MVNTINVTSKSQLLSWLAHLRESIVVNSAQTSETH